jgi:hypothetical protein
MVAYLQLLHVISYFYHLPDKFMAKSHPYTGIWHVSIVQMQVRPANTRTGNPDNGILGM